MNTFLKFQLNIIILLIANTYVNSQSKFTTLDVFPLNKQNLLTTVIDFDNDGDDDLITHQNNNYNSSNLYRNDGNNLFTDVSTDKNFPKNNYLTTSDFDKNSFMDVYQINGDTLRISFNDGQKFSSFINYGCGFYHFSSLFQVPFADIKSIKLGDFNNDGIYDIVAHVVNNSLSKIIGVKGLISNNTSCNFSFEKNTTTLIDLASTVTVSFQFADVDNDFDFDLLLAQGSSQYSNYNYFIYKNNGNSSFTLFNNSGYNVGRINGFGICGELNNDGKIDIISGASDCCVGGSGGNGNINPLYSFFSTPNGTYSSSTNAMLRASDRKYYQSASIVDMNLDGYQDVLWTAIDAYANSSSALQFYLNNGNSSFTEKSNDNGIQLGTPATTVMHTTQRSSVIDINNDLKPDLNIQSFGTYDNKFYNNYSMINTSSNHAVKIKLDACNGLREGWGAKIKYFCNGKWNYIQNASYTSNNNPYIYLGLGTATSIDTLIIDWVGGKQTKLTKIVTGKYLRISENNSCIYNKINPCDTLKAVITPKGNLTICSGNTLELVTTQGSNLMYEWFRDGKSLKYSNLNSYKADTTGGYSVKINNGICNVSSETIQIQVIATPNAPVFTRTFKTFCTQAYIKDIDPRTNLNWYLASTGGSPLSYDQQIDKAYYYASELNGTCESTLRTKFSVSVQNVQPPILSNTNFSFCHSEEKKIFDLYKNYNHRWYNVSEGGTSINTSTKLMTGNYYVSQFNSSGCSSTLRTKVSIDIINPLIPQNIPSNQMFCSIENNKVLNLNPSGSTIVWYKDQTKNLEINSNELLTSGLYVARTRSGNCLSKDTLAVQVSINDPILPQLPKENFTFCYASRPKVQDLYKDTNNINWYKQSFPGLRLNFSDELKSGAYYLRSHNSGCFSKDSTTISVNINNPLPPTSKNGIQNFCKSENKQIKDLEIDSIAFGSKLNWYSIKLNGTKLDSNYYLTNDSYYVKLETNGCESSESLFIKVNLLPVIINQTSDTSVCNGSNVELKLNLIKTQNTKFQWQIKSNGTWNNMLNDSNTIGANSNVLTIVKTDAKFHTTNYRCMFHELNYSCLTYSDSISLVVNESPKVELNDVSFCKGDSATVTAKIDRNGNYDYQWFVPNGAKNPGNVSSFKTIVPGEYQLKVTKSNFSNDFLCNSDFEDNLVSVNNIFINQSIFNCWKTSASDGKIEVWYNGFQAQTSYSGKQFIELNSTQASTLYQEFNAIPNENVVISFAHRGRFGVDEMKVEIGPVGGPYTSLGNYRDGDSAWGYYSIPYTFPATSSGKHVIRFISVSSAGGPSIGNLLDAVSIRSKYECDINLVKSNVKLSTPKTIGTITEATNSTNLSMCLGATMLLKGNVSGGSWISENQSLAKVNQNGIVTALGIGQPIIKYTFKDSLTGCENSVQKEIYILSLPTLPSITGPATLCFGSKAIYKASISGGSWGVVNDYMLLSSPQGLFRNNKFPPTNLYKTGVTYTISSKDKKCTATTTKSVWIRNVAASSISLTAPKQTIKVGEQVLATASTKIVGNSIVWLSASPSNVSVSGTSPYTALINGLRTTTGANITISIDDQVKGCRNAAFLPFTVTSATSLVSKDAEQDYSVTTSIVYPNPSSGLVNIENLGDGKTILLIDVTGRILQTNTDLKEGMQIDYTKISKGNYIISIQGQNTKKMQQITIE